MKNSFTSTYLLFSTILLILLSGCSQDKSNYRFLFVGHSYDWTNWRGDTVDDRLGKIKYSDFDGFWLGGDVCGNTSLNPKTMRSLAKQFDLKNPNSHFVLGNHDYRDNNLDFYFKATGRPDYYTSSFKNMVVSVLNTNLNSSDCENLDAQYEMLLNVCDTINEASHYVILMHHQIFKDINGLEGFKSNGACPFYSMNCSSSDTYFDTEFYPSLVGLQKKGVEVIVVVGDSGWDKGSERVSADGIKFLSSGINNSYYKGKDVDPKKLPADQVIIFDLDIEQQKLSYEFVQLNELSGTDFVEWFNDFPED